MSWLSSLAPRRLFLGALASGLAVACGSSDVFRPLSIQIEGLSARADLLTVKIWPASRGQTCANMSPELARLLDAPIRSEWLRSSGTPRMLEFPTIPEEGVTVVAVAEDPTGAPIQYLCRQVTFMEIGELNLGILTLALSHRDGP